MPKTSDRNRSSPVQRGGATSDRAKKPAPRKAPSGKHDAAKKRDAAKKTRTPKQRDAARKTRTPKKAGVASKPAGTGKAAPAKAAARPYAVRRSGIHGRGVFATRTIRKGADIIEYRGERITMKEADRRPPSDPDNEYHTFLFELDDGRVIDAAVRGNAARWINHSCAPNCEPYEDDEGRVYIAAKRTIRKGEELAYDYRLNVPGRITRAMQDAYACRCGAPRCRGTMLARKPR